MSALSEHRKSLSDAIAGPERSTGLGSTVVTVELFMPFYGSFAHFREAVDSVRRQDDPEWHLTVVDDVYPDLEPGRWVQALNDPRITYIRNEVNLRPSGNYNACIALATADHMVLMGCDDILLPGYLRTVRALLARFPAADLVQPGVAVIDEHGTRHRPLADRVKDLYRPKGSGPRELSGESLAVSLLRGNWTYFPSLVWRTDRLRGEGFRADLDVVQDLAKLFEIAAAGGTLVLDDDVVFEYRRHASSVSAVTGPDGSKFRQERTFFAHAAQVAQDRGWRRAARAAHWHVSSRLHALTDLPAAIRTRNATGRSTLMRHALGLPYR
jgi:glycosyltransferase involved in cell wall biosynthesis